MYLCTDRVFISRLDVRAAYPHSKCTKEFVYTLIDVHITTIPKRFAGIFPFETLEDMPWVESRRSLPAKITDRVAI